MNVERIATPGRVILCFLHGCEIKDACWVNERVSGIIFGGQHVVVLDYGTAVS
jgi:hypothetical protein